MNNSGFPAHGDGAAAANYPNSPATDNAGEIRQSVAAGEIEIDPVTGLPFLKNVHFNYLNIS